MFFMFVDSCFCLELSFKLSRVRKNPDLSQPLPLAQCLKHRLSKRFVVIEIVKEKS